MVIFEVKESLTETILIRVSVRMKDKLNQIAEEHNMSVAAVIRQLVDDELDK